MTKTPQQIKNEVKKEIEVCENCGKPQRGNHEGLIWCRDENGEFTGEKFKLSKIGGKE